MTPGERAARIAELEADRAALLLVLAQEGDRRPPADALGRARLRLSLVEGRLSALQEAAVGVGG